MTTWIKSWFGTPQVKENREERMTQTLEKTERQLQNMKLKRMQMLQEIDELNTQARANHKAGKRTEARACILEAKRLEKRCQVLQGQIQNLSLHTSNIESTATTVTVANMMKEGNDVMKDALEDVDVEDFDDIAADMETLTMESMEAAEALAMPISGGLDVDTDDQIDQLMDQWDEEQTLSYLLPLPAGESTAVANQEYKPNTNNKLEN